MRTGCLLLALALSAAAQTGAETEVARARRLLSSSQWKDKAWGAYIAGSLHSEALKDPLIEAFREAAPLRDAQGYSEEHAYVATLFDAAIQSGITVPADLLEPFEENWRPAAIILLARDRTAENSLLRIYDKAENVEWLAGGNLLLGLKSQRFYARTLGAIEISHRFTLIDPGDGSASDGGGGGVGCIDGVLAMPNGFPPVGVYSMIDVALPGDILLAHGPQDAYYRRSVAPPDRQTGFGVCRGNVDRQKIRAGYLSALTGGPESQVRYLFESPSRLEYRDEAVLRQEWDAALSAQEFAIREFVRTAQTHGLGSVTGMKLTITPTIQDLRKTTAGPTPALTPREFVLE
jgi:hypothetical protein